tara:strand:- start:5496 stop:5885 length:390 start_codon:yes stop_codon:yes gene_type:complete
MPSYPYTCPDCLFSFAINKQMADARRTENCPSCDTEVTQQSYAGRRVSGFVSSEGNWTGGKKVTQLHPKHPDAVVTSKKQMEEVYKRNGISLDTGHFISEEAQIKGTVPRVKRTGESDNAVISGVQEES